MALCARKWLPHEDDVIIDHITKSPSIYDGLRKAAVQLGRSFKSVEARYRRLKYKGLIPTLAQYTIQSYKTCQDGEPVHQSAKSTHYDIDRIIQHLLDSADTVVIYAGDYECRIVRTKRVQLAAIKQNVSC